MSWTLVHFGGVVFVPVTRVMRHRLQLRDLKGDYVRAVLLVSTLKDLEFGGISHGLITLLLIFTILVRCSEALLKCE